MQTGETQLPTDRASGRETPRVAEPTVRHRGRRRTVILVVVGVLVIAAHVILGGAVFAAPRWAGLATEAIVVIIAIKLAAIGVGYLIRRRRKAVRTRGR